MVLKVTSTHTQMCVDVNDKKKWLKIKLGNLGDTHAKRMKEKRSRGEKERKKINRHQEVDLKEGRMRRWIFQEYISLNLSQDHTISSGVHPQTLTTNPEHRLAAGCRWGEAGRRLWICMNYNWLIYRWGEKERWYRRGRGRKQMIK